MDVNNSNGQKAFYRKLQGKSDNYIIALLQRVVISLKRHEEKLAKDGLRPPYSSAALERTIQALANSRAELLELLFLIYADPYLNMLQAQNIMNSTTFTQRHAEAAPSVTTSRTSSMFNGYTPKSNLSKYNRLLGGRKRRTRRRRTSRR